MADHVWPANVPHRLLRAGAALTPGETVSRSATDSGLARQRATQTAALDLYAGQIRMTLAEMAAFDDFVKTVRGDVFDRPHPLTGEIVSCRFVAGQQGGRSPDSQTPKWLVSVTLEVME